MKILTHLSLLFVLLLGTCGPAQNGLQAQVNIPVSHPVDFISKFQDIHVDDQGTGFVAGRCGALRQTVTDGQMWETVDAPTDDDLLSVSCPPAGCATALLLSDQQLFRLSGGTWTEVNSPAAALGGTLHWQTADVVIHETTGSSLWRSVDAGLTWAEVVYPTSQRGNLTLLNNGTIYAWFAISLYVSTDFGASFAAVGYSHSTNISKQTWLDDQRGWLFDTDRLFYGTTDGGQTWTLLNAESQLNSVNWFEALSETHLVGAQITTQRLESVDGGVTWTRGTFLEGGNRRVNERYHRRGDAFFTVGDGSQILYSAADFADFEELDPFPRNDRIQHIVMASDTEGYALTGRQLLATTDGLTWSVINTFSRFYTDLLVLEDGRLVILTSSASEVSADGGMTFTPWVPTGLVPNGEYGAKWSRKPNGDFYLLGSNYATVSSDGGVTWTAINHNSDVSYNGLFWVTDDIGYAFTRQRHFAKTSDGGQSWTISEAPTTNLEGIWFNDELNGWVSNANTRYFTTDGGENWIFASGEGGYDFQLHPEDGSILVARYLGGNNGEISRSTDNGQTWRSLNYNCFAYRAGAATPNGKYFWTGGDGGFLVRHDLDALIEASNSTRAVNGIQYAALEAFPNPTGGLVEVLLPSVSSTGTLGVYDLTGREVARRPVARGSVRELVDLSTLSVGVYVLRWQAGGQAGRVRVVKR